MQLLTEDLATLGNTDDDDDEDDDDDGEN